MSSTVQICNLALTKVGAARITSLSDGSKQAGLLAAIFDMMRDAELAAHPWSFGVTRVEIPASSTAPAFGWGYAYPLPSDFIKAVQVGDDWSFYDSGPDGALFEFESIDDTPAILTDQASPLQLRYVRRVTNPGLFPALFAEALACRLAANSVESLTQNLGKREQAWVEYKDAVRQARRANAIERPPQRVPDSSWVRAMTLGTEG
ncbi:MAG: hypothetical protein RLZZ373_2678 [Pseudomonadota bacterium]|jgi:hypothetical protein